MKLGIFSDLHGNHSNLERALAAFKGDAVDEIVCLGDVLGKSGNNLRCLDLMVDARVKIVRGNHDRLGMNSLPAPYQQRLQKHLSGLLRIDNLLLSHTATCPDAIYGRGVWDDDRITTPVRAESQYKSDSCWIFFYGHTHVPALWEFDGNSPPAFAAISAPATIKLEKARRYLCNPGPLTNRKDIDIEVPGRKDAVLRIPSFIIFDTTTCELRYEIVA